MSNRQLTDTTIQIHPRALKALGLKKALVFLEVARDLRSGAIERDMYYQGSYGYECGSACCIYGHVDSRLFKSIKNRINRAVKLKDKDIALAELFAGAHPSIPALAANAIENYVLKGYDFPWAKCRVDKPND